MLVHFFFSSRRRHTRWPRDWSSDVCSSDLDAAGGGTRPRPKPRGAVRPGMSGVASPVYPDRKSTRLNSSHVAISYAVFCLKKKKKQKTPPPIKKKKKKKKQ